MTDIKILILGGDGMIGHQLLKHFEKKYETWVTLHNNKDTYRKLKLFNSDNSKYEIQAGNRGKLISVFEDIEPDIVINCFGIVKQRKEVENITECINVNALLPHQLCILCKDYSARLIQLSTDCVYSGRKGYYDETDIPDPVDIYGRTKCLGEVSDSCAITLRTSAIGLELMRNQGLIEWYLSQYDKVQGYSNAIYSGFTTLELANIIEKIIVRFPEMFGIWHVSSRPINKFDLLNNLTKKLNRKDVHVEMEENYKCDRSLNSEKFKVATNYNPPSWDEMLDNITEQIISRSK